MANDFEMTQSDMGCLLMGGISIHDSWYLLIVGNSIHGFEYLLMVIKIYSWFWSTSARLRRFFYGFPLISDIKIGQCNYDALIPSTLKKFVKSMNLS